MVNLLDHQVRKVIRSCLKPEHFRSCRGWILDLRMKGALDPFLAHDLMEFVDKVELNVAPPADLEFFPLQVGSFMVSRAPAAL